MLEDKWYWVDRILEEYLNIYENAYVQLSTWDTAPDYKTRLRVLEKISEITWILKQKDWPTVNLINYIK